MLGGQKVAIDEAWEVMFGTWDPRPHPTPPRWSSVICFLLQLNEHLKPARAHTSETGKKLMALGVPTEGPPSRPTTPQAILAYLHDMRCITSSTRANPGSLPTVGKRAFFWFLKWTAPLLRRQKDLHRHDSGQNREMSAGVFERPEISVVFPVDERNGCRY